MATTKRAKMNLEFLLVKAELKGIPEKGLLRSRNIGQIDLIWPRTGVAKKSGAREMVFKRGVCDFTGEPWAKRVVFREEIEDHCGLAVSITEPVSVQKVRRFLRLTAKYALKMGADFMEKAMVGYADIASSPHFHNMNLCLFFEGTGQGVAGKITNVTRLRDLCVDDARQKLHLELGLGTHFGSYLAGKIAGVDWRTTFRSARRWFEANYETLPKDTVSTKVFLFGFSRGALLARHFAAWLDKLGVDVAYLGLWDTVDATVGLDVAADCPCNVGRARHAVARDETRKFFRYVPLRGEKGRVVEMLFPGSHSDVGGLYADNHLMADLALAWIAAGAKREGLRLMRAARLSQKLDASAVVLHDSHGESSNLWGAFDRVRRTLPRIRLHFACKGI